MTQGVTGRSGSPASTAWMSWLRVLAIVGVVTVHVAGATAVAPDARSTLVGVVALIVDIGATHAVPLFVMLSGSMMLDPARYPGPGPFLRKRAIRLVAPLVFWHAWYAGILIVVLNRPAAPVTLLGQALSGRLYTALYFFWIVVGLCLLTPVLVPFLREAGRRGALALGIGAAAMTAAMMATVKLRGGSVVFTDSAFTWWIPYLGVFVLGFALKGVVVRGWRLALCVVATCALAALSIWQWRNPAAPAWLQTVSPVGYYGATVIVYACLIFVTGQNLIRPDGVLRFLTRPGWARVGRTLGDATLGVFGLHLTILLVMLRTGVVGGPDPAATNVAVLGLRIVVVVVVTYGIVLVLRKVPVVRAVL